MEIIFYVQVHGDCLIMQTHIQRKSCTPATSVLNSEINDNFEMAYQQGVCTVKQKLLSNRSPKRFIFNHNREIDYKNYKIEQPML